MWEWKHTSLHGIGVAVTREIVLRIAVEMKRNVDEGRILNCYIYMLVGLSVSEADVIVRDRLRGNRNCDVETKAFEYDKTERGKLKVPEAAFRLFKEAAAGLDNGGPQICNYGPGRAYRERATRTKMKPAHKITLQRAFPKAGDNRRERQVDGSIEMQRF